MALSGRLLLSASLQVALDRFVPREFKEFTRRVQVDSDLEELEEKMLMIQLVLHHHAKHEHITKQAGTGRLWLDKLTHLVSDIKDLLDEVATHAHQLKQEEETQPDTDQVRELVSSLGDFWSKAKQSGKIKTLIERLVKFLSLWERPVVGQVKSLLVSRQSGKIKTLIERLVKFLSLWERPVVFHAKSESRSGSSLKSSRNKLIDRHSVRWYHRTQIPSWLGSSSYSQLVKVELLGCRRLQLLPPLGSLQFLRYLLIEGLQGVKRVGAEFYGSVHVSKLPFQSLERLIFRDMKYWEEWFGIEEEREAVFPSLRELVISNCPKLRKFSHRFLKVKELKIKNCDKLIELPRCLPVLCRLEAEGCKAMVLRSVVDSSTPTLPLSFLSISRISNLENLLGGEGRSLLGCLNALRELEIEGCDELVKLLCSNDVRPGPQCLASLLSLKVSECSQLVCLSDDEDMLPLSSVTCLEISLCPRLHFLKFPSQVESIKIWGCPRLNSLPYCMYNLTSLQSLEIYECPSLVSFPEGGLPTSTLKILNIECCENLKSLPDGLHNATSLRRLSISECPNLDPFPKEGFPGNLDSLKILNCAKGKSISEWGIHNLTSLKSLTIGGFSGLVFFPECPLPPTLTILEINNLPDLQSLPEWFQSLTSLRGLGIYHCKNLAGLPDRGLPSSLAILSINNCPLLGKRCEAGKGEDWPKIAEIPELELR